MQLQKKLKDICREFDLCGEFVDGEAYGCGLINDTFRVTYRHRAISIRYLLQRVNAHVFKNPAELMQNIALITRHQLQKLKIAGVRDLQRSCLHLIYARNGLPYYVDDVGKYWRTYEFIENAHTFDSVQTPQQAFEAAAAFGRFQKALLDLPAAKLHATIPNFHHTIKRFKALEAAIAEDCQNLAQECKAEIDFSRQRESMAGVVVDLVQAGQIPTRIVHNDTKLNNVLLDDLTHKGICVIDLDTVMPGTVLYDFGDLVRSCTNPAAQDETDLRRVYLDLSLFEALAKGYLAQARSFLTQAEKAHLIFGVKLITFELGIRFLTDYLSGDQYFKTQYPQQNLNRCRTQFKLIKSIEANEIAMERILKKV